MLVYAYYTNLTPIDKALYKKCNSYHNELFNDVLKILTENLGHIYGFPYLRMITILKLSIQNGQGEFITSWAWSGYWF